MAKCPIGCGEVVMFNADAQLDEVPCIGCIGKTNNRYSETVAFPDIPSNIFEGSEVEDLSQHTVTQVSRPDATERREVTIQNVISCEDRSYVITSYETFVVNCARQATS